MLDLFNYITYLSSSLQRCNVMLYSIYLSWTLCCYDYVADAKKNIQDWTRSALLSGSVRSHLQSAFGVWTITYDLVIRVVLYNLQITWLVTRARLFFFLLAMCILLGRVGRTFSEPCINSMYNAAWIKSFFNKKKLLSVRSILYFIAHEMAAWWSDQYFSSVCLPFWTTRGIMLARARLTRPRPNRILFGHDQASHFLTYSILFFPTKPDFSLGRLILLSLLRRNCNHLLMPTYVSNRLVGGNWNESNWMDCSFNSKNKINSWSTVELLYDLQSTTLWQSIFVAGNWRAAYPLARTVCSFHWNWPHLHRRSLIFAHSTRDERRAVYASYCRYLIGRLKR